MVQAKSSIELKEPHQVEEIHSLYRNYFYERAVAAANVNTAFYSLKGLKSLANQLFLKNAGDDPHLVADGSIKALRYECKDAFNKATKIKRVNKVTLVQLDGDQGDEGQDITKAVSIEAGGEEVLVTFP